MEPQRIIAHFDLDSFFVSVEILNNPGLKGKPVIVGGSERGVVAACSYEARKFGIHSAMPSKRAAQLCPQAIFLKGNYAHYAQYSRWVTDIISKEAPLFEKASVDEFYIDLTGMQKFFEPMQWAIQLRQNIIEQTGLPISFGLSSNKMMAKMATNAAKPNGYLQIPFGKEQEFLAPLPVSDIPGVGKHTAEKLQALNIRFIRDLALADENILEEYLGKQGLDLRQKSLGIHHTEVSSYQEAKSISSENTFEENISDIKYLQQELVRLTEKICFQLRSDDKLAACVAVKIRYPDFQTVSKQASFSPTSADDEIIPLVKTLFLQLYKRGEPVRLLGVRLSEFKDFATQGNLFVDAEKKSHLYKAIDAMKSKFGKTSVRRASSS